MVLSLRQACALSNAAVVKMLLGRCAASIVDDVDAQGNTPLMVSSLGSCGSSFYKAASFSS